MSVDLSAAQEFLRNRFGSDVTDVALAGAGEWSRAFSFNAEGEEFIVRFGAHVEDFHKDRRAFAFRSPALPIPEVTEIGEAFGGFHAVSRRVSGVMLDHLGHDELVRTLPALFRGLDAVRAADVSATSGFGRWGADGTAPFSSWRDFLLSVADDDPATRTFGRASVAAIPTALRAFDSAFAQLGELVASCPEARHLVHGDLLNRNVLVEAGSLAGVIDWGCSLYGDFLYDIAWLSFWGPWFPAFEGIDIRAEALGHYESIGLAVPDLEARLLCYELHSGLGGGMAYQAYSNKTDELAWTIERLAQVTREHWPG